MNLVRKLLVLTLFLPISGLAYEELSQEAYFKVKENQLKFETIMATGTMNKARQQAAAVCRQWTTDEDRVEQRCECAAKELNKLDDETLFYLSMIAYERYVAKTKALQQGDQAKFEALKAQFEAAPLPIEELEKACP
jgi:hypothetical protein